MATHFDVHSADPQRRVIARIAGIVRGGGVIAYPTDSCYALCCQPGNIEGMTSCQGGDPGSYTFCPLPGKYRAGCSTRERKPSGYAYLVSQ
jgi:hypothetical protein